MESRQLINIASRPSVTSSAEEPSCSSFTLPSNGILTLNLTTTIILDGDALFQPPCNDSSNVIIAGSGVSSRIHFRDPFYASTLPECYALAATTVIAYMLVMMLLITPRTFLHEGALILGRRGFTNSPSGNDAEFGIGGRPWLQKAAAMTVAISLTIATADTFKVAEAQYDLGFMDAQELQKKVENGTELRIIRVISDTFLWLAQAQTLIRLFPRQREKVIIKWTAFALITLDELFSILNAFAYKGSSRPRSFVDAVPALAYLFQLALSLLYAAWVIYYSVTKKSFAFYHPQMKNICLVALLSLVSVLIPVVFFVTDISKPDVAGWGDYVRWVGAAAASVVVWEWVERIEALERNDKKDGVLGREVFDGDEMLDASSLTEFTQNNTPAGNNSTNKKAIRDNNGSKVNSSGHEWPSFTRFFNRAQSHEESTLETGNVVSRSKKKTSRSSLRPTKPPLAAVATTSTGYLVEASPESTASVVKYYPLREESTPTKHDTQHIDTSNLASMGALRQSEQPEEIGIQSNNFTDEQTCEDHTPTGLAHWNVCKPLVKAESLKIIGQEPHRIYPLTSEHHHPVKEHRNSHRWECRARIREFSGSQTIRLHKKKPESGPTKKNLPLTIIPAPPRRRDTTGTFLDSEGLKKTVYHPNHT